MKNIPDMKKWFNRKGLLICRGFLLWVASFGKGAEEAMSRAQSQVLYTIRVSQGVFLK